MVKMNFFDFIKLLGDYFRNRETIIKIRRALMTATGISKRDREVITDAIDKIVANLAILKARVEGRGKPTVCD